MCASYGGFTLAARSFVTKAEVSVVYTSLVGFIRATETVMKNKKNVVLPNELCVRK